MPVKNQREPVRQKSGCSRESGAVVTGPAGTCVGLACGHQVNHEPGVPGYEVKCPRCGGARSRGNGEGFYEIQALTGACRS